MSISKIASILHISYGNVYKFIKQLKKQGIVSKPVPGKRTRRQYKEDLKAIDKRRKLTPNMLAYLIDPNTVSAWAGLTLDERAVMLHRQFPDVKLTGRYICSIYKHNKVKRKAINIKKYSNPKTQIKIR